MYPFQGKDSGGFLYPGWREFIPSFEGPRTSVHLPSYYTLVVILMKGIIRVVRIGVYRERELA